jgi:Protein of unknown function (DUF3375)
MSRDDKQARFTNVNFTDVRLLLDHPSVRLLRRNHAAFILTFLHGSFKETAQHSIPEESLRARLEAWLEEQRDVFELERGAREYLEEWCSPDCGWLRKLLPGGGVMPVFELTAASEKALMWLEGLRGSAFVGTESRMESIFRGIEELLRETSPNAAARLEALESQRSAIEAEMEQIRATGEVKTLEAWQVNERFSRLLDEARTLLSDFRQVEENFRALAQDVVERRSDPESRKGQIVGRVLDAHDALRESPQGRSFYGFVRLLLDPERRERFELQAESVQSLAMLDDALRGDALLLDLLPRLRAEQEKVGESTHRLTSNLRRALESARLAERRRVRELVSEVQHLAMRARTQPPPRDDFFSVDELPVVWPAMSRPL